MCCGVDLGQEGQAKNGKVLTRKSQFGNLGDIYRHLSKHGLQMWLSCKNNWGQRDDDDTINYTWEEQLSPRVPNDFYMIY